MSAERLRPSEIAPDAINAVRGVETYLRQCGLDHNLLELVKMRASQINGCAFCLDMHSRALRRHGETEQRLYLLEAWDECDLFTPRERAALAWTEVVTRIADTRAPDDAYAAARAQFNEKELVDLTTAIATINVWNRLMISFRAQPAGDTRAAAA